MNALAQSSVWTQRVASRFGKAAESYERHALTQKIMASRLAAVIAEKRNIVPYGAVLEIGCGTGLLTNHLPLIFPYRELVISDASEEMIRECSRKFEGRFPGKFVVMDGENPPADEMFAAIVSNFAFHWFEDLDASLARLAKILLPKGKLIFSIPEQSSFCEWRTICAEEGIPFTANSLPSLSDVQAAAAAAGLVAAFQQTSSTVEHADLCQAMQSIRAIGASTKRSRNGLSINHVKKLMKRPGPVQFTYQVILAVMSHSQETC